MIITLKSQPLSSGYYFIFPLSFFESSEGHKFNIAKVSMIVLGIALAYFFIKKFQKVDKLQFYFVKSICSNEVHKDKLK
jgi:hypothetical protein